MAPKITSSKNNYAFSDAEYGYITMSANQTTNILHTNPVKFNTLVTGNITFDPVTYRVTLKANRTYRISASLQISGSNTDTYCDFRFYDSTGGVYVGVFSESLSTTYTNHASTQSITTAIYTPLVDSLIELRIMNPSAYFNNLYALAAYWEIQQINTVSPVIQQPYLVNARQQNLTVTGSGWTTVRAVGQAYVDPNGVWRLKFNILGNFSVAVTTCAVTVSGVVFKNIAGEHAISVTTDTVNAIASGYAGVNNGILNGGIVSGTRTSWAFAGDLELEGKPTWI